MSALLVLVTCPEDQADRIARGLIEGRLAACVNQLPGVRSSYLWKDEIQTDSESLLMIKTRKETFDALCAKVLALHPYELPEIIGVPIEQGHGPYLDWIQQCVSPASPS